MRYNLRPLPSRKKIKLNDNDESSTPPMLIVVNDKLLIKRVAWNFFDFVNMPTLCPKMEMFKAVQDRLDILGPILESGELEKHRFKLEIEHCYTITAYIRLVVLTPAYWDNYVKFLGKSSESYISHGGMNCHLSRLHKVIIGETEEYLPEASFVVKKEDLPALILK